MKAILSAALLVAFVFSLSLWPRTEAAAPPDLVAAKLSKLEASQREMVADIAHIKSDVAAIRRLLESR